MDEIDSIGSARIESGGGGDSGTVPDFYILEAKTNRKLVPRYEAVWPTASGVEDNFYYIFVFLPNV